MLFKYIQIDHLCYSHKTLYSSLMTICIQKGAQYRHKGIVKRALAFLDPLSKSLLRQSPLEEKSINFFPNSNIGLDCT